MIMTRRVCLCVSVMSCMLCMYYPQHGGFRQILSNFTEEETGTLKVKCEIFPPQGTSLPTPVYTHSHTEHISFPSPAYFTPHSQETGEKGQGIFHLCPPYFYSTEQWPIYVSHPSDTLSFFIPKFWMANIYSCGVPPRELTTPVVSLVACISHLCKRTKDWSVFS